MCRLWELVQRLVSGFHWCFLGGFSVVADSPLCGALDRVIGQRRG